MKNESIVDRVVERLKAQPLGDLITEEDLHDIVKEAIPKVFFAERAVREGSGYNERTVMKPPLIYDVMKELLREGAEKAAREWVVANAETVATFWEKILNDGVEQYVMKAQSERTSQHVRDTLKGFFNEINQQRQAAGLSPIYI